MFGIAHMAAPAHGGRRHRSPGGQDGRVQAWLLPPLQSQMSSRVPLTVVNPGSSRHRPEPVLTPLRVLQTTALDAAEFLSTSATQGTVDEGKDADLVLLGANPIEHAENLHDIHGVMRAGRFYTRADLAAIKHKVAAARSVS
jgi:cytosine/adenosine deaminase-related metal-dependent hydrolase